MKLSKKIIIIAIILAIITTYLTYNYINSIEKTFTDKDYIEVWVAKTNIPTKTKIDSSMIKSEKIVEDFVLKGAFKNKNAIIGKYTNERIVQGEQILINRLVEFNKTLFSYQIPKGKRAVTIKVDDVAAVSNLIEPGDYVDVVVYAPEKQIEEKGNKIIYPDITKIILQNMQVLAVNQQQDNSKENSENENEEQTKENITLAASPDEVERLILGDETAKIRLVLRHPEDDKNTETEGIIPKDIIPEKGKRVIPN